MILNFSKKKNSVNQCDTLKVLDLSFSSMWDGSMNDMVTLLCDATPRQHELRLIWKHNRLSSAWSRRRNAWTSLLKKQNIILSLEFEGLNQSLFIFVKSEKKFMIKNCIERMNSL